MPDCLTRKNNTPPVKPRYEERVFPPGTFVDSKDHRTTAATVDVKHRPGELVTHRRGVWVTKTTWVSWWRPSWTVWTSCHPHPC